jgi:hypothetical protein
MTGLPLTRRGEMGNFFEVPWSILEIFQRFFRDISGKLWGSAIHVPLPAGNFCTPRTPITGARGLGLGPARTSLANHI